MLTFSVAVQSVSVGDDDPKGAVHFGVDSEDTSRVSLILAPGHEGAPRYVLWFQRNGGLLSVEREDPKSKESADGQEQHDRGNDESQP